VIEEPRISMESSKLLLKKKAMMTSKWSQPRKESLKNVKMKVMRSHQEVDLVENHNSPEEVSHYAKTE